MNNVLDEEYFPYVGLSREESEVLRYIVGNISLLRSGELVQMSLKKDGDLVIANGMVYEPNTTSNKTFISKINISEHEVTIESKVCIVLTNEELTSFDKFSFEVFGIREESINEFGKTQEFLPYNSGEMKLTR